MFVWVLVYVSCSKSSGPSPNPSSLSVSSFTVNGNNQGNIYHDLNQLNLRFVFSSPLDKSSVPAAVTLKTFSGGSVTQTQQFENDSTLIVQATTLTPLTGYRFEISTALKNTSGGNLQNAVALNLYSAIDSTDKFPRISDSALLTLVEQQTFKYFYDFGHPVSGLARERNTSADVVTTGGSGFGVMALLVGAQRNFISRTAAWERINQMVDFLTNKTQRYHGAFPHWMNGATGATVPFSTNDNGADLVETSYLMQGLLTARQYFNTSDTGDVSLRAKINNLWNAVEWNWFRQNGQNVLYWHWSPTLAWIMNMPINGWDEAMIVYALAASSPVDSNRIPKVVYDNGWAMNGGIKNGKSFYGISLPLGPDYGGPLFFAHYSFLGINPNGLTDTYADYFVQNQHHTQINYNYCITNPQHFSGYSNACWGLTASDEQNGYSAHSPTNDNGTITPTAAISSLPYTPDESMNALRFFYYTLGDRIWGDYGFKDAFNLSSVWFADSYLAIDQGPEIIMIENYRTALLWNLFMSCPEIKTGMKNLGFQSTQLN